MKKTSIENETGELFGNLFSAYDRDNYLKSVGLFKRRFEDNGFNINYFQDKNCLDVGCGGGRYSIALSMLGAKSVTGIDISEMGINDAKRRAEDIGIGNVKFIQNTAEELPFDDESFDFIVFSGVLMHMENPDKGIHEIARVLKKGGMVYMLVYATEGVRWPLISLLRNFSKEIGFVNFDKVLAHSGELDVNKRRTYLDDLFVPNIDFYTEERLLNLLTLNGFSEINRWTRGRLDHEETLNAYLDDLSKLSSIYLIGMSMKDVFQEDIIHLFAAGHDMCLACIHYVKTIIGKCEKEHYTETHARQLVIGQGHHRLTAIKL